MASLAGEGMLVPPRTGEPLIARVKLDEGRRLFETRRLYADRLDLNELGGTVVVVTELRRAYPPRWVRRSQHLQRISVRLHPQLKSSLRVQRSNLAPIEPPWHEIASSPPAPRNDPDQIWSKSALKALLPWKFVQSDQTPITAPR